MYMCLIMRCLPRWGGVIYNLFFGFKDGVLWFVKVLFMLYFAFFVFSSILIYNKLYAFITLTLISSIIYIITYAYIGYYAPISIPLFGLGVFASLYKGKNYICFNVSLIPLIILAIIVAVLSYMITSKSLMIHSVINFTMIGILIILFTAFPIKITLPSILTAISFDIYLIHNKILQILILVDKVSLITFVILTAIVTIAFYYLRTKIIKI